MNIIAVDIGSYSIKFINCSVNKKVLKNIDYREILIDKVKKDLGLQVDEYQLIDIQHSIIEKYLEQNHKDQKIIFNISADYTTSRLFNLPVNSRKKANLMIPFQLEENIPHSTSDIHYTTSLYKDGNHFKALINIISLPFFEELYHKLTSKNILPNILTTELSIIQSCLDEWGNEEIVCLLDLGHSTSKAFFFNKNGVISSHHSHIAGNTINQTISNSYEINLEDAKIYKHQNCFFLTEDQYSSVDEDQQEFAKLMSKSISPLIQDLKRWIMGIRVKENLIVERIYITGGTANINNIDHFLSSELMTPVEFFDTGSLRQVDAKERLSFNGVALMAAGYQSPKPLGNFISGNFSTTSKSDVSLHSTVFLFTRSAMLAMIFMISFLIERTVFLGPESKKYDRLNIKLLKNKVLEIPSKTRKLYRKKSKRVLSYVKKKQRVINQEINTIQSATKVNALSPLAKLGQIIENNKLVNLKHFIHENNSSTAIFESSSKREIDLLEAHLKKSDLSNINIMNQKNKKTSKFELTLKYSGS